MFRKSESKLSVESVYAYRNDEDTIYRYGRSVSVPLKKNEFIAAYYHALKDEIEVSKPTDKVCSLTLAIKINGRINNEKFVNKEFTDIKTYHDFLVEKGVLQPRPALTN